MIKNTPLLNLCLAVVCTINLNAQVTITAADFNIITQDSVTQIVVNPSGVSFPQGGQNISWNYTVLTPQSSDTQGIGPNPSNSAGSSLFPSANVLFGNHIRDVFVLMSSTKMEWLGIYAKQPQPYYDLYTNPQTQKEFPFTYGSSYTDSSITLMVRPNVTYTRKSKVDSEIIGYGDLTTPANYYPDVLLERYVWDGVIIAPGSSTINFEETTYFFWAPGYYHPVMIFFEGYTNQSGNITTYNFISYFFGVTYVDLEELSNLNTTDISVFPNPATEVIQVDGVKSRAAYTIIASNGAVLQKGMLETNEQIINIEHLPHSNYLLHVEEEDNESVIQFVKQ